MSLLILGEDFNVLNQLKIDSCDPPITAIMY